MSANYDNSQMRIIDTREGFLVADAGPGTGKTHTIVGRCIEIIKDNIRNLDFRAGMLTFTRNAAGEMEERLLGECSKLQSEGEIDNDTYKKMTTAIRQMFIGTFDSFCLNILKKAPWEVSDFFGFKESLTTSASTTENETLNRVFFNRFISEWLEMYGTDPDYREFPAIVSQHPGELYNLINRLMCMGIVPMKRGWFGGTPRPRADDVGPANEPMELRGRPDVVLEHIASWANGWNEKHNASDEEDFAKHCFDTIMTDGLNLHFIDEDQQFKAAYDDRTALLMTIHDVYYRYMERCVATDHLTFGLTACFAFIALYNSSELREKVAMDHLIVDEFQDTNTLQMMISMMVLRKPNLCVVGDWRQGIYGFRYVSVENILDFNGRLRTLSRFLNDDVQRLPYSIPDDESISHESLDTSYRSSQLIVDTAYQALTIAATGEDSVDAEWARGILDDRLVSANNDILKDHTWVEKITCPGKEEEAEETVRRIISFVNDGTIVYDKHTKAFRPAKFSDVAVLCRRVKDCRTVYEKLRRHNVPAFLQGDMEIMNTPEGKILLAWMKYVENSFDTRGLVPILCHMGFSVNEIRPMLDDENLIPEAVRIQRSRLIRKKRRITDFISTVYGFHDISNDITQAIGDVLSSAHNGSLMTVSEMITMIETDIENETSYNVDGHPESNAVSIQTMHKSKGLEYAYVVMPYMDANCFPQSPRNRGTFTFAPSSGIRCSETMVVMANGDAELNGSWKTNMVLKAEPKDYDEERRLLFVAVSRAKQYITMISGHKSRSVNPSAFFKNLPGTEIEYTGGEIPILNNEAEKLIDVPEVTYERSVRPVSLSVHDIMDHGGRENTQRDKGKSKGMSYGTRVHKLAEMIARGTEPSAKDREDIPEIDIISRVIASEKNGIIYPEIRCTLSLTVDGRPVVLNGEIDLMVVYKDEVRIYDWKTDVDESFCEEYRTQLSVYANCAKREFEGRNVTASIVWLSTDNPRCQEIDVMSEDEISTRVRTVLNKHE